MFSATSSGLFKRLIISGQKHASLAKFSTSTRLTNAYAQQYSSEGELNGNNTNSVSYDSRGIRTQRNNNNNFDRSSSGGFASSNGFEGGARKDAFDFNDFVQRLSSLALPEAQRLLGFFLKNSMKDRVAAQLAFIRHLEKEIPEVIGQNHYSAVLSAASRLISKDVLMAIILADAGNSWRLEKLRAEGAYALNGVERELLRVSIN